MSVKDWERKALENLAGRTILSVGYMDKEEAEEFGWDSSCLVLYLDDGSALVPMSDGEGNAPGALAHEGPKVKVPVYPII